MLISAFEFERARWFPDGWCLANEEARRLIDGYEHSSGNWSRRPIWEQAIETQSGFWDPPRPTRGFACSLLGPRGKGRMRGRGRVALRAFLWETSFTDFLNGSSTTDFIIEELQPGTLAGPFPPSVSTWMRQPSAHASCGS